MSYADPKTSLRLQLPTTAVDSRRKNLSFPKRNSKSTILSPKFTIWSTKFPILTAVLVRAILRFDFQLLNTFRSITTLIQISNAYVVVSRGDSRRRFRRPRRRPLRANRHRGRIFRLLLDILLRTFADLRNRVDERNSGTAVQPRAPVE